MKRIFKTRTLALPYRLRTRSRLRRATTVQCTACLQWVKPRYMRDPAWVCKRCDHTGNSPAHMPTRRRNAVTIGGR